MIMPEKITSERITLQAAKNPTFKLAEEIYAAVDKSRENLKKWLPWAETTLSAEDEFMYLSDWCDKHWREGTAFAYLIRKSDNSEFLGVIDIIKVDEKNKTSEIGYWLSSDAEGKGYMSEALKALEPELFKAGINRIEIRNDPQIHIPQTLPNVPVTTLTEFYAKTVGLKTNNAFMTAISGQN